ncbi:MAG: maleylpyruvate isomerase N-terminal domain-containing protein [Sphingobacteriaceae bacterium]|nr:maleylpyruvate isomerase N-terminal domain-containing protein [Cytophagaceae bacterium]
MPPPVPIPVLGPLRHLDALLIDLLKSLSDDDWQRPTTARLWRVKDVAAHLLDGNLRTLSIARDGYSGDPPGEIGGYADLVGYLNRLNHDWVQATRRLSPAVLISLLESSGPAYCDYLASLDPFAPAPFSVAWAGETESANWFHIAREYTEKWHHQQQIRLATGRGEELLFSEELFRPLIETLLRALPHHYRDVPGALADVLRLTISGEGGGDWFLVWENVAWHLLRQTDAPPTASVSLPDRLAWRIFMKSIDPGEAQKQVSVSGRKNLGEHLLTMLAVMG